ncbi:MarR family winged helix-turn-helix transcriptional regulator [Streptomyces sp. NPDC001381]|uniref:MarR family winged helix-turn-helix transcriptional regulator n=1 Tax=Streptomyces sp. NPDC001381 TaxID=3364567 RepID=UPI00369040D4
MAEPRDSDNRDAGIDDISRIWERVVPMFSLMEGQLDRTLTSRHGVGLAPLMALGVLVGEHPGSVAVGGVARRLGVSVSAASRVLAHLESAGWTVRVAWPCDRRASRVAATGAGLALWARASRTLDRELDTAFRTLSFDERYAHVVARLCRAAEEPPAH